jgi:hypothetical protein
MFRAGLNILWLSLLMAGCAPFSSWMPTDSFRDPPYAKGEVVEGKYRTQSCGMCTTGSTGESAFFLGSSKYYIKDVGGQAEEILARIQKKEGWKSLGKNYSGDEKFFSPVRIFLISVDPIVIVTVPWAYKSKLDTPLTQHNLFEEGNAFSETDYSQASTSNYPLHWAKHLQMPIEVRRSLPVGTVQARVITADRDMAIVLPADSAGATAVELGRYSLMFSRAPDGKVLTSFKLKQ